MPSRRCWISVVAQKPSSYLRHTAYFVIFSWMSRCNLLVPPFYFVETRKSRSHSGCFLQIKRETLNSSVLLSAISLTPTRTCGICYQWPFIAYDPIVIFSSHRPIKPGCPNITSKVQDIYRGVSVSIELLVSYPLEQIFNSDCTKPKWDGLICDVMQYCDL